MFKRIKGRAISGFISEIREEGIDIFRLVVCPDSGIIRLTARAVHQSAFSIVNTFSTTYFGKGKHGIDNRVRCFKNQVVPKASNQFFPLLKFFFHIGFQFCFTVFIAGDGSIENKFFFRLKLLGRCPDNFRD